MEVKLIDIVVKVYCDNSVLMYTEVQDDLEYKLTRDITGFMMPMRRVDAKMKWLCRDTAYALSPEKTVGAVNQPEEIKETISYQLLQKTELRSRPSLSAREQNN